MFAHRLIESSQFEGDETAGAEGHSDAAQQIAEAGGAWAKTQYRKVDIIAYVFRLYLEWARLTAAKPSEMDYRWNADDEI